MHVAGKMCFMTNPTPKQLHRMATHPQEYVRYLQTGRLPQGVRPSSPLVTLLKALGPRELTGLIGVTVDSRLGYTGSRRFQTAAQALHWVAPSEEMFNGFPAESWRDKRFNRQLFLEDLLECCSKVPPGLLERNRRLCRPNQAGEP